jgi:FkbM family methyltransferase
MIDTAAATNSLEITLKTLQSLNDQGKYLEVIKLVEHTLKSGILHRDVYWQMALAAKAIDNLQLVDDTCRIIMNIDPEFWYARELPKHAHGYYAQSGQDEVIEKFFQHQKPKSKTFIEVGAFDGVHYSNVRRLVEKYGWTGISIEPVEKNFNKLQKSYIKHPVKCRRYAVGPTDGLTEIHVSTYPHLPDWGSDVASISEDEKHRWDKFGALWHTETVPLRRLTSIIQEEGISTLDLLSVDAEGHDLDVLKGLDFELFSPHLIVVDYGDTRDEILRFLASQGYTLWLDNGQDLFMGLVQGIHLSSDIKPPQTINYTGITGKQPYDEIQSSVENDIHNYISCQPADIGCIVIVGGYLGWEIDRLLAVYPLTEIHVFEPSKRYFADLSQRFNSNKRVHCHNYAVSNTDGTSLFHETSLEGTGSLLPMKHHQDDDASTWIAPGATVAEEYYVATVSLDRFAPLRNKVIDLLWCDVQGLELRVLTGATELLRTIKAIFLEVATHKTMYEGQCLFYDLDMYLARNDFYLRGIGLCHSGNSTGNALWVKRPLIQSSLPITPMQPQIKEHTDKVQETTNFKIAEQRQPKIVGLVPVRNEKHIISQCLRALACFTDAIVYLDDASTDETLQIVESLVCECHIERIIRKKEWHRDEPNDRNTMLQAGREIGGTHFIVIDADEILTSNFLENGTLQRVIYSLKPGDRLALNWIQLWRSIDQYRFDHSIWTWNYKDIIFCDDGKSAYSSEFIHTPRVPDNLLGTRYVVEGYESGLLHFQFVNWRNLLIKQAWYRCLEHIREPQKAIEEINSRYAPSKDEKGLGLMPSPDYWFSGYPFFDRNVFDEPDIWRITQINEWFERFGKDYFTDLDIWDLGINTLIDENRSKSGLDKLSKSNLQQRHNHPMVTAIVSTYNSSRFIGGCLEDLVAQSLFQKNELEIIIINSGSEQDEEAIVRQFQKSTSSIKYLKTERESLYSSWNRAIRMASGRFITNANTDDRHRNDALELLAAELDAHPDVDLVYSDCHVSTIANETFEENAKLQLYRYPEYFAPAVLLHYQFGPQPMWRKSVHESVGYFDDSFKAAGDYDFNIRFSLSGRKAKHISAPLGLYLEHPEAISFKDDTMALENARIASRYRKSETLEALYRIAGVECSSSKLRARIHIDMGMRALEYFPPWKLKSAECNAFFAAYCFQKATELDPESLAAWNNFAYSLHMLNDVKGTREARAKAERLVADGMSANDKKAASLPRNSTMTILPSELSLPSQRDLGFPPSFTKETVITHKTRILFACDHFWPSIGGSELFVQEIATRLIKEGYHVDVATSWISQRTDTNHKRIRILQFRCGGNLNEGGPSGEIEEYRRLITNGNYDAVIVLGHPDLWVGLGIVNLPTPHPRIIFLPSINAENILNWSNSGLFDQAAEILKSADTLVAVTESGYDTKFMNAVGLKHHFIPHAVGQNADPASFRKTYEIPDESPLMVMVANFWPVKNHLALLQILANTPRDWHLFLIGHPISSQMHYFSQVKEQAALDHRVRIIEGLPPDRAASAIRDADLILIPSKGESAGPLVLLQAMSFATPWIATPECNAVNDEAGGVVASLADFPFVIERMLAFPEISRRLGHSGQEHWRTSFTWEKIWPALMNILENRNEIVDLSMPQTIRYANEAIVKELLSKKVQAATRHDESRRKSSMTFSESSLAHSYCKGKGLEIGGSAHNPFGLDTLNVDASGSMETYFKDEERINCGSAMPVDIVANGDNIPLPDSSQDYIVSSHVLEHFPNPIKALLEWDRLIKPGGVIFMIIPHKDRTFEKDRPRTTLDHLLEDFLNDPPVDAEWPHQHYHCWITEDILQMIEWMQHNLGVHWHLAEVQDVDDKVGNGFTVVIRKIESRAIPKNLINPLENHPNVSIIVPTCNRSAILRDFLASLESQTYPKDRFELIIVDDGSTDDTETVVSSFMPSFKLEYFKQENRGPAAARNKGIRNARGELILIMNDDAIAAPDLVEKHVAAHAKYHDEKTIVLGSFPFAEAYLNTPLMHLFQQSDILFQYSRMKAHERYDYRYFWTCNISIPHRAFTEAGLFDEDFRDPAGEDTELGYRLWDKGYTITYEPECRTQHAHSIPLINYCRRQVSVGRNNIIVAAKHPEITTTVTGLHNIADAEQTVSSWLKANSEIAIKAFNAIRSVDVEIEKERAGNIAKNIETIIPIVNQFWLYQGFMDGLSEFCTERVSSSERLRITLLSPGTAISGGVKIIFEYCNRLAERGHEVNLVTLDGKKPSWFQFSANVRYIEASWDEYHLMRLLPDADVIFATFWATAYLVSRFPACKGKRYYLVQDYESQTIASPEEADPTYLLPLNTIVVSTWLKETLSQLFGQHSLVVPNAVDHSIFYNDPSHRKCFPLTDFRVGMLWHHEERKGLATGMAAFQMIKNHIPDAKLVLMGVKRPEQILFDEFQENISGDDVRLFYSSLDVFVSNSTQEGFGLPGLEAMACGIPLVTTDSGGVRDYAVHQKTALVVPVRDPDAIAKAVLLLAEDTNLRESLRIAGLEKSAQFSWDSSVSMIEAALIGNYATSRSVEVRMNDQSAGKEVQRREKISIAVFSLDSKSHACGYYRIYSPALALADSVNLFWGLKDNLRELQITNEELDAVDLIIIQRFFPRPETKEFIDYLFTLGKPIVYEIDDLLTQLPSSNPSYDGGMLSKPYIFDVARKCSAITTSTDALSRHFNAYNDNVHILPNLLNSSLWCKTTPPSQGPVIIGYAGTITHSADLTLLEEVLERVSSKYGNRVAFSFMGCATERISRLPGFSFISFETTYEAYARKLQEIPLDIMLVPLEDNPFNRCKSNIKWLEYSACGIAGIYADLPPYNTTVTHGKTGLLVGQNTDKWVHAIELLIEHPDLRKQISRQAREEVLSKYTLQQGVHRYLDLYENLLNNCAKRQTGVTSETSAGKVIVSIIIPLFNQLTYTKQCLEALACSTGTTIPYEVILVDNGSTDGTLDFLSSTDSTIRVLSNPSNLGFAKASNQGAALADGEYLVFLNNDTIPQPGWLDALVSSAAVNGADICGSKLLYPDGRVQHAGVAFDERGIGYHIFKNFPSDAKAVNSKRFMQCVTGACMLISKKLFQQLGGFDELFMNGFEDVDLCLRAGTEGKKVLYTPESVLIHFEEKSEGRKIHDDRNMKLFLSRWGGKVRCDDDLFYRNEGFMQQQNAEGKIVIRPIEQNNISNQGPRA